MKPPLLQGNSNDFQTPPQALTPLYKYLNPNWTIWECACGKGNIVKALKGEGYDVVASDLFVDYGEESFRDFLTDTPSRPFDCIITNPPYSIKQKFLERAYSLGKPFAFLLPLTTFETSKRQGLFRQYGLEVILFDKRINFETPSGNGSGAWFATAWFTWGLGIGKQLTFETLD